MSSNMTKKKTFLPSVSHDYLYLFNMKEGINVTTMLDAQGESTRFTRTKTEDEEQVCQMTTFFIARWRTRTLTRYLKLRSMNVSKATAWRWTLFLSINLGLSPTLATALRGCLGMNTLPRVLFPLLLTIRPILVLIHIVLILRSFFLYLIFTLT